MADLLQSLAEHSDIKRVVGNGRQTLVKVHQNGRYPSTDARVNFPKIQLNPLNRAAVFVSQFFEQSAISAAKVNHATVPIDVLHQQFVSNCRLWVRHAVAFFTHRDDLLKFFLRPCVVVL